jgi:hypothetical protein
LGASRGNAFGQFGIWEHDKSVGQMHQQKDQKAKDMSQIWGSDVVVDIRRKQSLRSHL